MGGSAGQGRRGRRREWCGVVCCVVLRCVVLCCVVLCCVVLCCVVLCCVVLRRGVARGVAWRGVAGCAVLCCAVLCCAVLCCAVLCCAVVWCGVVWCGLVWCGVVWCGVVWCGVVWCVAARRGTAWRGVAWCGVVWCGGVGWGGVGWGGVGWGGVGWGGVGWSGVGQGWVGWMDAWMDGCTALVPVRYTVCPGPIVFFPCLLGISLHSLFLPSPIHALEHALSGRIHSSFQASTYLLLVCACALLSSVFSPLPPFTLSLPLVAPWCGAPHSCLRILEVSFGSSLATCRRAGLGHLHTVYRLLHCMGPFCRLGPPG